MGGSSLIKTYWGYGPNDMDAAYKEARNEAVVEFGYNSYSGSLATTNGVYLSQFSKKTPTSEHTISNDMVDRILERTEKRGSVEAIYVSEYNYSPHYIDAPSLRLRITPGDKELDYRFVHDYNDKVDKEIRDKVKSTIRVKIMKMIKDGEIKLPDGAVLGKNAELEVGVNRVRTVQAQKKTRTVTTDGQRVTKYFIVNPDNETMPKWGDGFTSQAEARKNLNNKLPIGSSQEIIAITRRDTGAGLVNHQVTGYKNKTVEVEVEPRITVMVSNGKQKRTGWMFLGWGAS